MKKYNHAYTIAFSINTDNESKDVTALELVSGILNRVSDITSSDISEIHEACGLPFDTYENEEI